MENSDKKEGTEAENALAQQYYDFAVLKLNPKIKKYLNLNVSAGILTGRISKCRKYFKKLTEIQYEISKLDPDKELKYTKTGSEEPQIYFAGAIDTQAKNWLNRLSITLNLMVIKKSEHDVRISFTRDVIILIISIFVSVIIYVLGKK